MIARAVLTLALVLLASPARSEDLGAKIRGLLDAHGQGIQAGIWIGGVAGEPTTSLNPDLELATASCIKSAYLVEFFAARADALDQPVPEAEAVLDAPDHPALAPYTDEQKANIRKALKGLNARTLGATMMGAVEAPNDVYNAAASVITAVLGGPEALTAKIAARDPAFATIKVRRYMLAPRDQPGDNTGTARALAAVMAKMATESIRGVPRSAAHALKHATESKVVDGRRLQFKTGSLDTDPITRCRTGWIESPEGPVVYAIMLTQPGPGDRPRPEAAQALHDLVGVIEDLACKEGKAPGR